MIKIIAVGSLKEDYFKIAIKEGLSKIKSSTKIIEVKDLSTREGASERELQGLLAKEAAEILRNINPKDYVIALAINGAKIVPRKLKELITENEKLYKRDTVLLIGGSVGLGQEVINRADKLISIGKLTYPHQMMRVLLLELLNMAMEGK